jgi:hypothetical protein
MAATGMDKDQAGILYPFSDLFLCLYDLHEKLIPVLVSSFIYLFLAFCDVFE